MAGPFRWAVRRINLEPRPFALIDTNGRHGDEFLAWRISESFAPVLAKIVNARLQG